MDIAAIIENLGLPVAMVIWLSMSHNKQQDLARQDMKEREAQSAAVLERFGRCMDNFNDTLIKIDVRLSHVEHGLEQIIKESEPK